MPLGMIGKYERLDVLGHGVSGIVYLAKDTLLNKQVALKEVDVQAGDLRRFLEEARVMDRLRHPNIVRVNNVDRIEGKVVIDMEYVRGQNLQEMLRQEGAQPLERAIDICAQVLDALAYAHHMQTVHRDIKPANILIARDGQIKLVDFGLAEILATNAYAGGAGTYAYMAPEDSAEDDRSDHQSDIWAVGVTLYEMVTIHRPFNVMKVKDPFAWKRILETEAPTPLLAYLPEETPHLHELQVVIDRALARDKRQRYATAGSFREDLLKIRNGQSLLPDTRRQRRIPVLQRVGQALNNHYTANSALQSSQALSKSEMTNPAFNSGSQPAASNSMPANVAASVPRMDIFGHIVAEDTTSTSENIDITEAMAAQPVSPRPAWLSAQPAGRVVAEVENPTGPSQRGRTAKLPASRRNTTTRLFVEPGRVDFGSVRKGETSSVKIMARVAGADGDVEGRLRNGSEWLTAHPPAFERARQAITLTAHTDRAWETGEFYDTIQIETNAGSAEIPVRLIVLPARPRFSQVAAWYIPLFVCALLPALAIAFASGQTAHHTVPFIASYMPSAALGSCILGLMLLLVTIVADIGIAERLACGIQIAVMCAVLGLSSSQIGHAAHSAGYAMVSVRAFERAFVVGGFMGGVILLQLLHLRKWKLWAFVIGALGLASGGILIKILA